MSRFFRSPNSSASSSSGCSSGEEDVSEEARETNVSRIEDSSPQDVSQSSEISLESLAFSRRGSASGPSWHRDFLLHALLEERCMNEVLRERGGNVARQSSREDRELQAEAQSRYRKLCAQLAPLNLVSTGLDQERHQSTRQKYRDGLDLLGRGSINTAVESNGPPGPLRRLLTDSNVVSKYGQHSRIYNYNRSDDAASMLDSFAPSHQLLVPSQYLRDFEELGVLGKGGYGTVFHVRHKLDGLAYAVKKVPIRPSMVARIQSTDGETALNEILTELKTLAKLEHPNIVRYFNSWIEWSTNCTLDPYSDETVPKHGQFDNAIANGLRDHTSSLHRVFTESDAQEDAGFTFESQSLVSTSGLGWASGVTPSDAISNSATDAALWSSSEPTLALHMQMAMYPMTLQDFLSPKPNGEVTPLVHCFHLEPSVAIMLAMIDGVEYLHSEGIIHRDLKPANIFLRLENNPRSANGCVDLFLCPKCRAEKRANPATLSVRIGDFGLVTSIAQHGKGTNDASQPAVGTEIYRPAASKSSISPRLDIFALGVIMFELLCKFDTQMERRQTLQQVRSGKFPPHFSGVAGNASSSVLDCISLMLSNDLFDVNISFDELRERLSSILTDRLGGYATLS